MAPSKQRPKGASPSSGERGRLEVGSHFALFCEGRALSRPYEAWRKSQTEALLKQSYYSPFNGTTFAIFLNLVPLNDE